MLISKPNLTQDEQVLHHRAAILKKNLEAYRSCTRGDKTNWRDGFRALLVFCILVHFHELSIPQKGSMKFFFNVNARSDTPPRVHPLLLSLAAVYDKSNDSPNISSVSEDDPRVLSNKYYTSPSDLPPLDIHFPGQNGATLLGDAHGSPLTLTSAASCQECMASQPQDNSVGVGNMAMTTSSAASIPEPVVSEAQEISAEVANEPITNPRKGKRRRRASSGAVHSESLIFIAMLCWVKKLLPKQLLQDRQLNGVLLMTLLKQLPVLRPKDLWKVMKM